MNDIEVTILVIMLLTVVYNESQFVTDYQDVYEKVIDKSAIPFELCDLTPPRLCRKSNTWREFFKNVHDDVGDVSHEYPHEFSNDEDTKAKDVKIRQLEVVKKRNRPHKIDSQDVYQCATLKTHVDLGVGYYPSVIGNITCDYETNELLEICPSGWSCQPVKHIARVLSKYSLQDEIPRDLPYELKGCWLFKEIPIHVGCRCERTL